MSVPQAASEAVLVHSSACTTPEVQGFEFTDKANIREVEGQKEVDFSKLVDSLITTGFQATAAGRAIDEVNRMLDWSLDDETIPADEDPEEGFVDRQRRKQVRAKIWLAYTSNMISSGVRESIRYLAQHGMVQVIVASAGGVEEDFIKCMAPTHLGDFSLDGCALRKKGLNRIGNLIAPNDNYVKFEEWFTPIIHAMHDEQERDGIIWTPSSIIHRLGKEINDPRSVYYWTYKNNIPVFCPALTDGSLGDMLYFHSYKRPGFIVDISGDIRKINDQAVSARKTGCIVIGGGLVKHHTMNANLMRNGTDFCVYLSTAQEFDGSDSGARPDEAKSWGKIRVDATPVKVHADASLIFPFLVGKCFAPRVLSGEWEQQGRMPDCEGKTGVVFNKSLTPDEQEVERKKAFGNKAEE